VPSRSPEFARFGRRFGRRDLVARGRYFVRVAETLERELDDLLGRDQWTDDEYRRFLRVLIALNEAVGEDVGRVLRASDRRRRGGQQESAAATAP
jgi:hypothetical protein